MNQFLKIYPKLLSLLCPIFIQLTSIAYSECSTSLSTYQTDYMIVTQEERTEINVDSVINDIIRIPVVPHILMPDSISENNSFFTQEKLNTVFVNLNEAFSEAGFIFNQCTPNYHTYTEPIRYAIHPTSNEFFIANETAQPRALNIYFTPDAIRGNGESVCGWASFPGEYYQSGKNWIVIRNDCATNGSTVIHEVGHYFNLYHTHQNENARLGIVEQELADASNCGIGAGDELCGTPAEPYRGGNGINGIVNENCEILCEYKDMEDNLYIPAFDDQHNVSVEGINYNYMSYAPYKCRNHFTEDQIHRMKVSYLIDRNYLSVDCPGVTPNQNECDAAKDLKVLFKLYTSINGPIPGAWEGVAFNNEGCVTQINLDGSNLNEENKLTGSLPIEIEDLWHLETLNLSNNNICGTLPASIGNMPQLDTLNLSNNQIKGEIPDEINGLQNLMVLDLSNNNLCGYIPYQIKDMTTLNVLNLSNNPFSGCLRNDVRKFANKKNNDGFVNSMEICNACNINDWTALKHIHKNILSGNCLSAMDSLLISDFFSADSVPDNCNLGHLSFVGLNHYGRVKTIILPDCGLTDSLSSVISLLEDLIWLDLSNNNLIDTIPNSFSDLKKLTFLGLIGNNMANCLPVSLTRLCEQASIVLPEDASPSFVWRDEFCQGLGGYCEDVSDYVMPGDFNNDKKVTNVDFIYWNNANGTSNGIVREDVHAAWLPQFCDDWSGASLEVNHKHQDANGDGKIDEADLQVFYLNLGKGTGNGELFNADLPNTFNDNIDLELVGDGQNGFFVKIKDVENIQMLVFTIGLSDQSYNNVSFDYTGISNTPIMEDVQWIEDANHIEVTLEWHPDFPPPTEDDPFGRLHVKVADEIGEGDAFLRIDNINILSNNVLVFGDGLDYAFDNEAMGGILCVQDQVIEGSLNVTDTYNAFNSIVAPPQDEQGVFGETYVNGCTNIIFNAGGSICLNPGFKNQHGTVFSAQIEPCTPAKLNNPFREHSHLNVFPNPATEQTTIAFDLDERATVSLNITDMAGKHTANPINRVTKEKGKHNIQYNTSQLPTGVYYCTLKQNETISTQKLIIVR